MSEGLRATLFVSPFLRVFTGRFCVCVLGVLCLFVLFSSFRFEV